MAWVPFAAMLASKAMDSFGGGDQMTKVPTMTREQKGLLSQLMKMLNPQGQLGGAQQGAINYQQQLMDPSSQAVDQFAQPYMNQFNQQTIPGLAERFAGMGAMGGGLSSSGFGQALGAAGGNLQTQLAALKAGLGQNAAQSLMSQYGGLTGQALGAQPFGYQQQGPSMFGGALQGWAQGGFGGLGQGNSMNNNSFQNQSISRGGGMNGSNGFSLDQLRGY
jgi:hypothetical protein